MVWISNSSLPRLPFVYTVTIWLMNLLSGKESLVSQQFQLSQLSHFTTFTTPLGVAWRFTGDSCIGYMLNLHGEFFFAVTITRWCTSAVLLTSTVQKSVVEEGCGCVIICCSQLRDVTTPEYLITYFSLVRFMNFVWVSLYFSVSYTWHISLAHTVRPLLCISIGFINVQQKQPFAYEVDRTSFLLIYLQ